ncbi:inositol polyphosphate kinase-domain-containing protein, partial [Blastocladiella britannica]
DKYYGRELAPSALLRALVGFLDDGVAVRTECIPRILARLRELARVVADLDDFRFYASSLLLLYDGDGRDADLGSSFETEAEPPSHAPHPANGQCDVRIIDFANCVTEARAYRAAPRRAVPYPPTTDGPDQGYLLGLRNLMRGFDLIARQFGNGRVPRSTFGDHLAALDAAVAEGLFEDSVAGGGMPVPW